MAASIFGVLRIFPNKVTSFLKNFLTKEEVYYYDAPFKIATKYSFSLVIIIMCICSGNEWASGQDIVCNGGDSDQDKSELNEHCWAHGTFIVDKYLSPEWNGKIPYPGVGSYTRGEDEIIEQLYYNHLWLILGKIAIAFCIPYFLWKGRGLSKMSAFADVDGTLLAEERADRFYDSNGANNGFSKQFLAHKFLCCFITFAVHIYLSSIIPKYAFYGISQLLDFNWPPARDVVFPKSAKCSMLQYGSGGDVDNISAICRLPLNIFSQWLFLLFWWWTIFSFVVSIASLTHLLWFAHSSTKRNVCFKKQVVKICRNVDECLIDTNISFGDWLVLHFIKSNVEEWQFTEFLLCFISNTRQNIVKIETSPT